MNQNKRALVFGAGGFIGGHLVRRLKSEGYFVKGVDLKYPEFAKTSADEFLIGDLRSPELVEKLFGECFHEVYQLAADMGGAGYIFSGNHDADVMHNSALINLNVAKAASKNKIDRLFYSSSACIYPEFNQLDPLNPNTAERSAYPANPDSEYGWEKLFSERLYMSYVRNYQLEVKIARFHNIFGPEGAWRGGREKAPAAICRKVAEAKDGASIEIWGDGQQTRSFLYVDECIEGIRRLMQSDFAGPVNIGSEEMVSINAFTKAIIQLSGKDLSIHNIEGPTGVRGRNSDNQLIQEKLAWKPTAALIDGLRQTYAWIEQQVLNESQS